MGFIVVVDVSFVHLYVLLDGAYLSLDRGEISCFCCTETCLVQENVHMVCCNTQESCAILCTLIVSSVESIHKSNEQHMAISNQISLYTG
jgi:hypothetical protein